MVKTLLLVAALATAAAAFGPSPGATSSQLVISKTRLQSATDDHDACYSRRDALSAAAAAAAALTFLPTKAVAGVGAPILFDEACKVYFTGALTNTVAALRVESALRWTNISSKRRKRNYKNMKAKYGPRNTLVARCACSDDATPVGDSLAGMLGKDLTDRGVSGVITLDCGSGGLPGANLMQDLATQARKLAASGNARSDINIVLIFGSHVGIAKDGRVGYVERRTNDVEEVAVSEYAKAAKEGSSRDEEARAISTAAKQAYKTIRGKVETQVAAALGGEGGFWDGISELTIVGGVTINRSKYGKEGGEDCFYALSAKTLTSEGKTIDIYDGAFGDRDISPKDRE